jgi:hypothetical protein
MIEHNLVNYFPIHHYPLVLSNHTIGLIQVVTQVKLPVHQYVPLLYSPFFTHLYSSLYSSFYIFYISALNKMGRETELIIRNSHPLQHTKSQ